jgi:hypothetical protein
MTPSTPRSCWPPHRRGEQHGHRRSRRAFGIAMKVRHRSVPKASQKVAQKQQPGRRSCGNSAHWKRDERFYVVDEGCPRREKKCSWTKQPTTQQIIQWTLIGPLVCLPLCGVSAAVQGTPAKPEVHNLQEMAKALNACMRPLEVPDHYQGIRITARLGLNARGQPLGPPQFTYVTPTAPERIKIEYKTAILDALRRCTPLPFSNKLGATIAGVPLILSFDEGGLTRVRLAGSSAYVAPAPLPSSQIPPARPIPLPLQPPTRQGPPIWLPGLASPIPSLPHGPETSQDRQARCIFQSRLYGVPPTNLSQYLGLCTQ